MIKCTDCGFENQDGELFCRNPDGCGLPLDSGLVEPEDGGGALPEFGGEDPAAGEVPVGGAPAGAEPSGDIPTEPDVPSEPSEPESGGEPSPEETSPALPDGPVAEPPAPEEAVDAAPPREGWSPNWCETCGADRKGESCDACAGIPVAPTLVLEVLGHDRVRFGHHEVKRIRVTLDSLSIGRTDPMQNLFPNIDLRAEHSRGKGLVSRRHAEICRRRSGGLKHYLICRTSNPETTHIRKGGDSPPRPLGAEEEVLLEKDDVFIIGEEVAFRVVSVEE